MKGFKHVRQGHRWANKRFRTFSEIFPEFPRKNSEIFLFLLFTFFTFYFTFIFIRFYFDFTFPEKLQPKPRYHLHDTPAVIETKQSCWLK